jgi:hypothetical protein
MLFTETFQYLFHYGAPEEFGLIFDPETVAIDTQRLCLTIVQHQGKPVLPS